MYISPRKKKKNTSVTVFPQEKIKEEINASLDALLHPKLINQKMVMVEPCKSNCPFNIL